jgi:hypothetical protein
MTIKNPSAMEVKYCWEFHNVGMLNDIQVDLEVLKKCKGHKVPMNQIFDILPVRAALRPGEHETVEISYYAFPGYAVKTVAICRVSITNCFLTSSIPLHYSLTISLQ